MGSGLRATTTARKGVAAADRIVLPPKAQAAGSRTETTGVPCAHGLVRARVSRQLDRFAEVRIGAVIAPAGAGKTTALAHWARSSALDVTWWRASSRGGDPVEQTVRGLAEAIHVLAPHRARATCRDSLLDCLQQYDGSPVIVIDDFHHVDHPDVGFLLEDLLQASSTRLVIASRIEPSLNLARSELPTVVVGAEDLRFRQPETQDLFARIHHEPLSDEDAWILTRQTDGLAAALHLFHQATHGAGEVSRRDALRDFPVGATFAVGYIAREILAGLGSEDLQLLRTTSPLETLTAARCSDLVGSVCDARLRSLVRRGLLRRLPGGFAVARVVRRHLLDELREELGELEFTEHVRRCAARMDADGLPAAAVRAYVSVGDWTSARAVLEGDGPAVLGDPDLDWLDHPAVTGSWARVGGAVRHLRAGRLGAARDALGSEPPHRPATLVGIDTRLRRMVRVWTEGDIAPGPDWLERLRAAVHRPDPRRRGQVGAAGQRDVEHRLLHAVECAVAGDLMTARRLAEVTPNGGAAVLGLSALSALLTGATAIDRLVDEAERGGIPWIVRLAGGLGDPTSLPRRIDDADAVGDRWGALALAGLRAVLGLRQGTPSVADLEDVVGRCRSMTVPALEAWARAGLALAAAWTGSPDAGREAEMAVGFAHTAQVPGALALSWGVLGTVRNDPGLLADAAAEAERIGLGCRPWEWMSPPVDRGEGRTADRHLDPAPGRAALGVATRVPPLELRCLGGFEVRVGGEEPKFAGVRPRARALLRMLALHAGVPVHREMLVEAMWPQLDATAGTHNLHVCVSSLRAALEPGVARGASRLLVRDGDRYLLALPAGSIADLRDFDVATRQADKARTHGDVEGATVALEQALELYAGDVLPEDGPSEWVVGVRDRYRVRAAEAAALLADLHLAQGRAGDAAAAAQRSIDIEPCRDASWRVLIKAYDAAQDLAAAERARRSYASVLASLGVVETTADLVRTARPASAARPTGARPTP